MTNTKTIKTLMTDEISALRMGRAPEDFQVFYSADFILNSMARMWDKWEHFALTMSMDYHISYEEAIRICAINEELGLAVNYAENCDTNEALEILPYLGYLASEGGELIDVVRTRLPEEQAARTTTFVQLQSIIGSMYKSVLYKALATRRTLTMLHGGRGMIELTGEELVNLPEASDFATAEILEEFDCEMNCTNCKHDVGSCAFRSLKKERGLLYEKED